MERGLELIEKMELIIKEEIKELEKERDDLTKYEIRKLQSLNRYKVGDIVQTKSNNYAGKISAVHDKCPMSQNQLNGLNKPVLPESINDQWYTILIFNGGSVCVPKYDIICYIPATCDEDVDDFIRNWLRKYYKRGDNLTEKIEYAMRLYEDKYKINEVVEKHDSFETLINCWVNKNYNDKKDCNKLFMECVTDVSKEYKGNDNINIDKFIGYWNSAIKLFHKQHKK